MIVVEESVQSVLTSEEKIVSLPFVAVGGLKCFDGPQEPFFRGFRILCHDAELAAQEANAVLDKMLYEDARKEFNLASMTGFGADGSKEDKEHDFEQVRGDFESNAFVKAVLDHIKTKEALGDELIARLSGERN